jgi:tRNA-uridine 2-sulfurtransferase
MAKRVFAALSGGVDSSVAALLLREQGFDVSGVHLRLVHNEDLGQGLESGCCSLSDAEDARCAAYRLGLNFYVFDFSAEFRAQVARRFVEGYGRGETPNPCMDCNRFIKWGALLRRAETLGYDAVATGHYARIERDGETGRWLLRRGADSGKDQSYFLSRLTQTQLSRTLLPLGDLTKPQVRQLAEDAGLSTAHKRDSQDLCFAPDGDYAAFCQRFSGKTIGKGNILDEKGNIIGEHRGYLRYTLGQHRHLGIPSDTPLYVCGRNPADNTLTVGPESALYSRRLIAGDMNWISVPGLTAPLRVTVQTRYHQPSQSAAALPLPDGTVLVEFDDPQRAVTPGQTAALYDGDSVVGAGTILETRK